MLAALLLATTLAGCSKDNNKPSASGSASPNASASGNTSPAASEANKPDISKKVTLNWYLLGDAHKDTEKVVAEWNKMLEQDLNTTVKLNFTSWTDWQTKYNLLLTSGEKIDMIFASSWADYYKFAKKGAFMDLKDLLPTYAPETWNTVPKQDWDDVSVGESIFAVPSTFPEYTPDGIVYREDWRQQLNLPEITDLNSIEAYLDGVKKAKPKVIPINGKAWNEQFYLFLSNFDFKQIGGDSGLIVAKSYDTPRDIVAYPFTQEFEDWVKRMKTWAQKGFWSSNTLSDQQEAGDGIKTGNGAVYWRNPAGAGGFINDLKKSNPDIQLGYFPFTRFHNYATPNLSINNGMAIPKSAANPERSLMVLDKLRNDPKYFNLMTYGIAGLHYDDLGDGKHIVVPAKGQDPKVVTKYDIASWGWRYEPNMRSEEGGWDGLDKLNEEFKAESKPNIFAPVLMDYQEVKTQVTAVNQVFQQYGQPLMMGLVSDPEKALATYREKLKKAGIDELLAYVQKQTNAYLDEKGIQ
ncbi:extracellular solute-binding protein [Cohnella endophytica]|uniref:Extracellular solute-binding protein n=2 Tax=Cohnella endophytica TaxID=2419778 RepID=A0A494Y3J2_9BACL|nr:extracellular solute-binding protein [Cohnella endophytica]